MLGFHQVFVIQDRASGRFLTRDLNWARSLKEAGRLTDAIEAADTVVDQSSFLDSEIHSFFEVA